MEAKYYYLPFRYRAEDLAAKKERSYEVTEELIGRYATLSMNKYLKEGKKDLLIELDAILSKPLTDEAERIMIQMIKVAKPILQMVKK